jgi:hypothetical protein
MQTNNNKDPIVPATPNIVIGEIKLDDLVPVLSPHPQHRSVCV